MAGPMSMDTIGTMSFWFEDMSVSFPHYLSLQLPKRSQPVRDQPSSYKCDYLLS